MDKWAQKRSWIAREQELGYAQQALAQQLQQQGGVEMDSLVSGVKNSLNRTVKKKVILISMYWRCSSILYAEDKYDITK
jgi:outer membrane protein